ncbi:MAG: hypothetical protein RLZZ543_2257 [Bacteroidota bacterium]|jgi:hypothetical protein
MNAVETYIHDLTQEQRSLFHAIRELIIDAGPAVTEKIAYRIPFFYSFGPLCYLNPYNGGVDLGFHRGMELSDAQGILETRDRNVVRSIAILNWNEFLEKRNTIREVVQEALLLNEMRKAEKKQRNFTRNHR